MDFQDSLDDQVIKTIFEESFIDRKKTATGTLIPSPYEVFVVDKSGKRMSVDPCLTKKFGKVFDLECLSRVEVEFSQNTDFTALRQEYDRVLKADKQAPPTHDGSTSTDLIGCIKNYAKPEQLDGEDKW
jgi:hypothetical protein